MNYQEQYQGKLQTLEAAQALIHSGDVIAVSGAITEPTAFLGRLQEIIPRLEDVILVKSKDNDYEYLRDPATKGHILTLGHFYHTNFREGHALGIASYLPSDLHNYMRLRTAYKPNNVFIAKVTDMDENGNFQIPYCQMFEREAYACAETVILEINPRFRRVRGGVDIPIDRVACCYIADSPLLTIPRSKPSPVDEAIGAYIADMIHDGDCFQLGIGGLPDTIGRHLFDKNDLGIHSEVFSSTMADLIENGNVTGKYKQIDKGEHIAAFALGDDHLYATLSENDACHIMPSSYANDPFVIAQNDNMISVNTALEIDLTGQICSESIGPVQWSGTGGAADFAYGALHSRGGRGVIAFSSTAKKGSVSRIKVTLTPGAAVSISRNLADIIVTEYGVAYMRGRSVQERAAQLIEIAHPDFRDELRDGAKALGYI
ncbi:MAG: 4-hydroxybutyrate--acetyl-CoA CoA transferase [Oscillospiraceae bacterium]|nr:4-hydroxybutyrate--acetyl-CoA CoA transferase [Oscillospiraceae bacterium]